MSQEKQTADELVNFFEKKKNLDSTQKKNVAGYFEELSTFFSLGKSKFFCYVHVMSGERMLRVPCVTLRGTEFDKLERVEISAADYVVPEAMPDLMSLHTHLLFQKNLNLATFDDLKKYLFTELELNSCEDTEEELAKIKLDEGSWVAEMTDSQGRYSPLILSFPHAKGTHVVSQNLKLLKEIINKKIKTPKDTAATANFWDGF